MNFNTATLHKTADLIRAKALSPVELVEAHLARTRELNPTVNAYVYVGEEPAMRDAKRAEAEIMDGRYRGPLHGIPVSVKDIFNTTDMPTNFGQRSLAKHIPDHNAAIVERLKQAGAIIIGARKGRYSADGRVTPMPGSNLPLATLGTFILWMGWFGFNGGSQLALGTGADAAAISAIYINTNLSAAAGVVRLHPQVA